MDEMRKFIQGGLLEGMKPSVMPDEEILAESKSAEEWWDRLPGKRRKRVSVILGMSKGKDRVPFKKLDNGAQSEIEAYFVKHKGKVEGAPSPILEGMTQKRISRVELDWKKIAKVPVNVEFITGMFIGKTTELGALRLHRHYRFSNDKARSEYSKNMKTWVFTLETSL